MAAAPLTAEKVLSRKSESDLSVLQFRKRFLIWLNLWLSALIGDLLSASARQ